MAVSFLGTLFRFGGAKSFDMKDADISVDDATSQARLISVTSITVSLTATRKVTFNVADGSDYIISNDTTGAQNVRVTGPNGGFVDIAPGAIQSLVVKGGNMVAPAVATTLTSPLAGEVTGLYNSNTVAKFSGATVPPTVAANKVLVATSSTVMIFAALTDAYIDPAAAISASKIGAPGGDVTGASLSASIVSGIGNTIATVNYHATSGIAVDTTIASVAWSWAQRAGVGANVGGGYAWSAQQGQQQNGSNANNNGGGFSFNLGAPGTGGSGAAGVYGNFTVVGASTRLTVSDSAMTSNVATRTLQDGTGVATVTWALASAGATSMTIGAAVTGFTLGWTISSVGVGSATTIIGQTAKNGSAAAGGALILGSGAGDGAGAPGGIQFKDGAVALGVFSKLGTQWLTTLDAAATGYTVQANTANQFFQLQATGTSGAIYLSVADQVYFRDSGSVTAVSVVPVSAGNTLIQYAKTVTSAQIKQSPQTTDVICNAITITPQQAFATATGANRKPGDVIIDLGTPQNSGTAEARLVINRGGAFSAAFGPYESGGTSFSAAYFGLSGFVPSSSNFVFLGNGINSTYLNVPSGGSITLAFSGSSSNAGSLNLTSTSLSWATTSLTPTLTQGTNTSDVVCQDFRVQPQRAFATATGANRVPGNFIVDVGAPTNGGTAEARLIVKRNGVFSASIGPYETSGGTYTAVYCGPGLTPSTTNFCFLSTGIALTQLNSPSAVGEVDITFAGIPKFVFQNANAQFAAAVAAPLFGQLPQTTDVVPPNLTVSASSAWSSAVTNTAGGFLLIQGGAAKTNGTTGLRGGVRLQVGADTAETLVEVTEVVLGNRVVALCQIGSGITSTQMPAQTGDGVIWVGNATTAPTTGSPSGGGILFASAGAGKWKGSSGTVTTFGPAEPHCPRCDRDFAHEWESSKYGKLSICVSCMVDALHEAGITQDQFVIERKAA